MAFHPDSIRKMRRWEVVTLAGEVVMTAEDVTIHAAMERCRPCDVAKREARNLVNVEAGDEPLVARREVRDDG